ncbi:hypothetical protein ACLOJK_037222 [Asimina triloba]
MARILPGLAALIRHHATAMDSPLSCAIRHCLARRRMLGSGRRSHHAMVIRSAQICCLQLTVQPNRGRWVFGAAMATPRRHARISPDLAPPARISPPPSSTVGSRELGATTVIAIEEDNQRMIEHRSLSPLPRSLAGLAVAAAYLSSPRQTKMGFGATMATPCVGDGAPYLGAPVVYGARCTYRCGILLTKEASILRLLLKTTSINLKLTSDPVPKLPGSKRENLRTQNSGGVGSFILRLPRV